MDGFVLSIGVFVAVVAAVACMAALLTAGCLAVAVALPHGHPGADRLRAFAASVPKAIWRAARRLDASLTLGAVAAAVAAALFLS